jgi:hypothetical protein
VLKGRLKACVRTEKCAVGPIPMKTSGDFLGIYLMKNSTNVSTKGGKNLG